MRVTSDSNLACQDSCQYDAGHNCLVCNRINPLLKRIVRIVNKCTIETGGAMKEHIVDIKYKNDGDSYYKISIPFWSHNQYVVNSCFNLVHRLTSSHIGVGNTIYLRNNKFLIHIFESYCDPD